MIEHETNGNATHHIEHPQVDFSDQVLIRPHSCSGKVLVMVRVVILNGVSLQCVKGFAKEFLGRGGG